MIRLVYKKLTSTIHFEHYFGNYGTYQSPVFRLSSSELVKFDIQHTLRNSIQNYGTYQSPIFRLSLPEFVKFENLHIIHNYTENYG